jgi:flagellar biosynthesis protein FlhF
MELKRILARDTKTANERAIALYGRNVLVISNHTVGGQTELVVAVDIDESSDQTTNPVVAAVSAGTHEAAQPAKSRDFAEVMSAVSRPQAAAPKEPATQRASVLAAAQSFDMQLSKSASEVQERDMLHGREIMDLIRDELASLRREFNLSQKTSGWQSGLNLAPEVQALMDSFTEAGMPASLRALLLDTVKDMRDEREALASVRNQLEQALQREPAAVPRHGVHVLAGPSGSGKSLMVAKLARLAAKRDGADHIAIVSYKDLRVGAWSQVQLLAEHIGVDAFSVQDAAELPALFERLKGRHLILIDTPGSQTLERVAEVKNAFPQAQAHMVMSADASSATLNRAMRATSARWDSLMVTKLDESVQPWPLVEFLCDNRLPLNAAGDGNQLGDLRRELEIRSLVEMAVAQLARTASAASVEPIKALAQQPSVKPLPPAPSPSARLYAAVAPRGMRGAYN